MSDDPRRDAASLPLIPLLHAGDGAVDRDVLATWHEVLGDVVGVELPHDLFALWLYPAAGGFALLGPEALAQDNLPVPVPQPRLTEEQAAALGDIVRRAGYASVVCLPVRFGRTDVGLMLVATFPEDRYGAPERELLERIADALAPTLARLARQQGESGAVPAPPDLAAELAAAWTEARSPRDFFTLASCALGRVVPHDVLEVLVPGPAAGEQYRLGAHAGGPPWADPTLVIGKQRLDLVALFGHEPTLLVADVGTDGRWPAGMFADDLARGQVVRSLAGVRVTSSGHLVAHVLVGSIRAALYRADDLATLTRLGEVLAPKIEAYVLTSQLYVLRRQLLSLRNAPSHLARVADMLSTTAQFAEATRRLAEEARAMLPCDRLTLAVRLSEGDRVVLVEPGETKHWADLPVVTIGDTPLGQVLKGQVADVITETQKHTELIVPIRVAGRTIGALALAAKGFGAIGRQDVAQAQHLADLVAPHVELVRRAVMLPAPVLPSWKQ